jgi:hypothetical protein
VTFRGKNIPNQGKSQSKCPDISVKFFLSPTIFYYFPSPSPEQEIEAKKTEKKKILSLHDTFLRLGSCLPCWSDAKDCGVIVGLDPGPHV